MDIYKKFVFEAAHRLPRLPPGHKCGRLHGHSFTIVIYASGQIGADTGWVQDFGSIKKAFQPVYDILDHSYLNEIGGLENPTSENIAVWVWPRLLPDLPLLSRIDVHETTNSACVYRGPK